MLQIIGSSLIVVSTTLIGWSLVAHMKKRIRELYELQYYILMLEGEIQCANQDLYHCFQNISHHASGCWKNFFSDVLKEMEGEKKKEFREIWEDAMKKICNKTALTAEQQREWKCLGNNLGYLDQEMQIAWLDICEKKMERFEEKEREKFQERAKLYQSIGIMSGLFMVILLV